MFFEKDVYEYKLHYEWCIISYYFNPFKEDMNDSFLQVWNTHYVDDGTKQNSLENYKFYSKKLCSYKQNDEWTSLWENAVEIVKLSLEAGFKTSTPSLVTFGDPIFFHVHHIFFFVYYFT